MTAEERAVVEQLVGALREVHKLLHYETGPALDRISFADQIICSALALAAEKRLTPSPPRE